MPSDLPLNPYESPREAGGNQGLAAEPRLGVYSPVVSARDVLDVVLGGSYGLLFASVIYGVPFCILFWLQAPIVAYGLATALIVALAVLTLLVGIRRVELTADGIVASRTVLPALRCSWTEVSSVETVDRRTIMLALLLTPHRCCSYSLTLRDQFLISGGGIRFFFPPQDAATFRTTVETLGRLQLPAN